MDKIRDPTNYVDIGINKKDVTKQRVAKNIEMAKLNKDKRFSSCSTSTALKHQVYGETLIDRIKVKLEENVMAYFFLS